eukprot:2592996-Rhodomonas_salina.1
MRRRTAEGPAKAGHSSSRSLRSATCLPHTLAQYSTLSTALPPTYPSFARHTLYPCSVLHCPRHTLAQYRTAPATR